MSSGWVATRFSKTWSGFHGRAERARRTGGKMSGVSQDACACRWCAWRLEELALLGLARAPAPLADGGGLAVLLEKACSTPRSGLRPPPVPCNERRSPWPDLRPPRARTAAGTVRSRTGPCTIWFGSEAAKLIAPLPRAERAERVFPEELNSWRLYAFWRGIREEAGLPGLRIHDCRHTWTSPPSAGCSDKGGSPARAAGQGTARSEHRAAMAARHEGSRLEFQA